jgi:redox-sensitive bicupin YhaK (pirin superfamily)
MNQRRQIVNATKMGGMGLRLIGTTDIDGNGTPHEIADVDPIVLFDFAKYNSRNELPFRPHPHIGLTAMSFLPTTGTIMAWDSLNGDEETHLQPGGLYYVHAGLPAFHYEYPSPDTVAAEVDMEFIQLVWNASDENDVKTVIVQPQDVPLITTDDATIRVLAGEFCGVESIQPFTHRKIVYAYVQLQKGKSLELKIPQSMKGVLFPIEGNLSVNEDRVNEHQMMVLGEEDHTLSITDLKSDCGSRFIIAAGEPLNRPFYKMIGLGGFIIGETEKEVRTQMEEFSVTADQLKTEIPHYFPKK